MHHLRRTLGSTCFLALFALVLEACGSDDDERSSGAAAGATGGASHTGGATAIGGATATGGVAATGGAGATGGASHTGGVIATGGVGDTGGADDAGRAGGAGGNGGATPEGGTIEAGGAPVEGGASTEGGAVEVGGSSEAGGTGALGGADETGGTIDAGGADDAGGAGGNGGATATGGTGGEGGAGEAWPNIRVVGNRLCDRWGTPFALRSIESMFGNGTSDAAAFVAGHRALGANALGPLPNSSVSSAGDVEDLLAAAYAEGLVIGLNADHTGQGEGFFQDSELQTIINRYPNVFLQEAVELGSDMAEEEWVAAAQAKVDAYVDLYPDKPLKIGSPFGGRSPRFALDRCEDVVDYYYQRGGRGGVIFTCQLYWRATEADWSYQEENGFSDGLPGILDAIDAMAASPCLFLPGLDNEDDVGYTGWREVMDHVRESSTDPGLRLGFQWWVYYNEGDSYDNDLTTDPDDALAGITSTGADVKERLELDRQYIELGPLNP